jgi:hypothetical protein
MVTQLTANPTQPHPPRLFWTATSDLGWWREFPIRPGPLSRRKSQGQGRGAGAAGDESQSPEDRRRHCTGPSSDCSHAGFSDRCSEPTGGRHDDQT